MGWATRYIEELQQGATIQFRPRGNSMAGKIDSGQLVTVQPSGERELTVGMIVLCKVGKAQYLHLIKAIRGQQFQIGNNRGGISERPLFSALCGRRDQTSIVIPL